MNSIISANNPCKRRKLSNINNCKSSNSHCNNDFYTNQNAQILNITAINNKEEQLSLFKSQLQDVFEKLPPLSDVCLKIQPDPYQTFQDLFEVFQGNKAPFPVQSFQSFPSFQPFQPFIPFQPSQSYQSLQSPQSSQCSQSSKLLFHPQNHSQHHQQQQNQRNLRIQQKNQQQIQIDQSKLYQQYQQQLKFNNNNNNNSNIKNNNNSNNNNNNNKSNTSNIGLSLPLIQLSPRDRDKDKDRNRDRDRVKVNKNRNKRKCKKSTSSISAVAVNNNNSNNNNNNKKPIISRYCYDNGDKNKYSSKRSNYSIPAHVLHTVKQREIALIRKRVGLRIVKIVKTINDAIVKNEKKRKCDNNNSNNSNNNNDKSIIDILGSFGFPMNAIGTKTEFVINDELKEIITKRITLKLETWNGGRYKTKLHDEKDCYNKTRTYWNRQKAQQLGDELFGPILCMFVMNRYELDDPEKMELFIQIYQELCKETIQFDRSMARPLVLNACYFKSNKWKDACEMFIKCFSHNISWQSVKATKSVKVNGKTTYEYIRDDNRSQQLHDEFEKILKTIKQQLSQKPINYNFMQKGIKLFQSWIQDSNSTNSHSSYYRFSHF